MPRPNAAFGCLHGPSPSNPISCVVLALYRPWIEFSSCELSRLAESASESCGACVLCSSGDSVLSGTGDGFISPVKLFQPRRYSGSDLRLISMGVNRAFAASHPDTNCSFVATGPLHDPGFARLRRPAHHCAPRRNSLVRVAIHCFNSVLSATPRSNE
jgi:hypothetical protein